MGELSEVKKVLGKSFPQNNFITFSEEINPTLSIKLAS